MRIHGICLVKNEGDIIRHFLTRSAEWCDRIYIYDNGSTDGTWEAAQETARKLPHIVLYRSEDKPFDDALRAEVFAHYRGDASRGDWWCRLDADEFYVDDPRAFLTSVPAKHHVVWTTHLQYYFTTADLERFSSADETAPPAMHADNLPRYYIANGAEARFFRHRPGLVWAGGAWPRHLGLVEPRRIRVQHFQYRSPAQIQRRLDTRRAAAARGWQHFDHSLAPTWREIISKQDGLHLDRRDGNFEIDPAQLPNHLEPPMQRAIKRVMHGFGIWP
jgi:glycosyltransferase involved in cell wall biosynthesis